ncbi:ribosome hibernation promotion factor [Amycolatopsis suaedae]|uniref:HPF/RaiA family ribosome-associated protein n=1 Tax=Amycolatopsis suaedae TaxID=2510978 RepID=A0A4Q7JEJ4_9PSEU|nr:HPF/RaiA family ribosome-associated protein [Amycolatopsis suaedae]RZQ65919.1 HPF/RaiA family ribosome-associated protein [Amycolatopsis suaedae]
MAQHTVSPAPVIRTSVQDGLPSDLAGYARRKIGKLTRFTHRPVLDVRVRLTLASHASPLPVVARGSLDVNGRIVRAEVAAAEPREAVDRLEARLHRQLEQLGRFRRRSGEQPQDRPHRDPRPVEERRIVRRKSYTLATATVDDAVEEMLLLDHGFHLFTESGSGHDSVVYRSGPTGLRLAQAAATPAERLASHHLPVTISPQPAPTLSTGEAVDRLNLTGLPFQFFLDADLGRASALYHRYDGHYGLITPAV